MSSELTPDERAALMVGSFMQAFGAAELEISRALARLLLTDPDAVAIIEQVPFARKILALKEALKEAQEAGQDFDGLVRGLSAMQQISQNRNRLAHDSFRLGEDGGVQCFGGTLDRPILSASWTSQQMRQFQDTLLSLQAALSQFPPKPVDAVEDWIMALTPGGLFGLASEEREPPEFRDPMYRLFVEALNHKKGT